MDAGRCRSIVVASARLTRRVAALGEPAPGLFTVDWITSSLPRWTSTSVTAPLRVLRVEIEQMRLALLRAFSIRVLSSSRIDCDSTDLPPDDIIESKRADGERRGGVDRGETVGQQHLGRD
jgi:hypothetical protein